MSRDDIKSACEKDRVPTTAITFHSCDVTFCRRFQDSDSENEEITDVFVCKWILTSVGPYRVPKYLSWACVFFYVKPTSKWSVFAHKNASNHRGDGGRSQRSPSQGVIARSARVHEQKSVEIGAKLRENSGEGFG